MVERGRLPGAVIGQIFRADGGLTREFPRRAGIIAKALDIRLFRDAGITRGLVVGEQLPFSGVTYTAPLSSPAIPDKARARLYMSDGRSVTVSRWNFSESTPGSNVFDQITIDPAIFSSVTSYSFDYVANDPDLVDEIPVDDLREILAVGDGRSQVKYREGTDFYLPTTVTGPTAGTSNAFGATRGVSVVSVHPSNSVTGDNTAPNPIISFNSSAYSHDYNRHYEIEVISASGAPAARVAVLEVRALPTSAGNAVSLPRDLDIENGITISLVEATPATLTGIATEFGVTLNFAFGAAGNFVPGDKYAYDGLGLGVIEPDAKMLNTNQFAAVSAVAAVGALAGEATITTNAQSLFTGSDNQTYEIECTAAGGVTPNRTATLRWRSNPSLKKLTGTVTATLSSASLVGIGSAFLSELTVGDKLLVDNNGFVVQVLSVTNNNLATLTAVSPFATTTSVPCLRYRQRSSTINIAEASLTRLALDSGILFDVSLGSALPGDNFTIGDTFTLTASPARIVYNGKENRSYDMTVTSATGPHQTTVSFSGSTPAATFGSVIMSEGNPLVLPNNAVFHARNTSGAPRYSISPAGDTFDVAMTPDGTIDWTLEKEVTEVISTSSLLRDLTGSRTGTVGAFYVLLNKVPTSVTYVRGPSPTFADLAFNVVSGTTIVWFTTNPTVNMTIKYRTAGLEPSPGATYYMTGYYKRPDTDYSMPQTFASRSEAVDFLAPMTITNDAAIANEIAWDQDELSLPGVVVVLVKDSDGDGQYVPADYADAIRVSQEMEATTDFTVVNQFAAREEFRDSIVNSNDPTIARRRIGYNGFPTNYPIGDEFTAGSRIYTARRELQVFEETVARGSIACIGNSFAKKTIRVDSLGDGSVDSIPTQVTLDGSFLAVGLAARVSSFSEPWMTVYNLPMSGFDDIEVLTKTQMIALQDAGIICLNVEDGTATYVGTMTTDETEPSTEQLSGTVQRQYVLNRLQAAVNKRVIGMVADTPEEAASYLQSEIVSELGSMISEGKIGRYTDENGAARELDVTKDVTAVRDRRDPTKSYFRCGWNNKYATLYVDGLVSVDGI